MMKWIKVLVLMFFFNTVVHTALAGNMVFTHTTVDDGGDSGWEKVFVGSEAATAVGPDNSVHVVYYDETNTAFKYAGKNGNTWNVTVLDNPDAYNGYDSNITIAVDSVGAVHVLYMFRENVLNVAVRYALYKDNKWSILHLASIREGLPAARILIADSGIINLLYSGDHLYHAKKISGEWVVEDVVDISIHKWNAAVDGNYLFVTYKNSTDNDDMNLYMYNGDKWIKNVVNSNINIQRPSIAADSSGNIHIVGGDYCEFGCYYGIHDITVRPDLELTESIIDYDDTQIGYFSDLIMDSLDNMHIIASDHLYFDDYVVAFYYYFVQKNGIYYKQLIEEGDYEAKSIALDSTGSSHIVYYDAVRGDLKYATNAVSPDPSDFDVYDSNGDCLIGDFELLKAIDDWAVNALNDFSLLDLIDKWATGDYCE